MGENGKVVRYCLGIPSPPFRYQNPDPNHRPKPISAFPRGDAVYKPRYLPASPKSNHIHSILKLQIVSRSAPPTLAVPIPYRWGYSHGHPFSGSMHLRYLLTALYQSGNAPFEICISTVSVFPISFSKKQIEIRRRGGPSHLISSYPKPGRPIRTHNLIQGVRLPAEKKREG